MTRGKTALEESIDKQREYRERIKKVAEELRKKKEEEEAKK